MKKSQRIYDRDFKEMAVLLSHEGSTIEKIEQELNITKTLLNRWRQDFYKYGKGSFPGCGNLRLSPEDNKIYLLKKRIEKADIIAKSKFPTLLNEISIFSANIM